MKRRLLVLFAVAVSLLFATSSSPSPAKAQTHAFSSAADQAATPSSGDVADAPTRSPQPPNPIIVEYAGQIGGPTNAVALSGSILVLASGPRLVLLDMTDPSQLGEMGNLELKTVIFDVAVQGVYAFVITDELTIVYLSNPARPRKLGTYNELPLGAQHLDVEGDYVYLSGDPLSIVDVSNPQHPSLAGTYSIQYAVRKLHVEGTYAYVLYSDYYFTSMKVVDVADPANPTLAGSINFRGWAEDLAPEGDYVYVSVNGLDPYRLNGGLCAVDISEPTQPAVAGCTPDGSFDYSFYASSLATTPDYVFAGNRLSGLRTYRIDDPRHPLLVGEAGLPGGAMDLALDTASRVVYATNGLGGGVFAVDVADADGARPLGWQVLSGTPELPGTPSKLAVANNHAFVAAEASGLHVVDIADPSQPREVGALAGWAPVTDVAIDTNRAYVTRGAGKELGIVNVADPGNPTLMGSLQLPGEANGVSIRNGFAFVANGGFGLRVVAVADSAHPVAVGAADTPGNARSVTLSPDGRYAYVADWEAGLRVVDVADVRRPFETGFYDTPGLASGVATESHYAYVADQTRGLVILDVADPVHPVRISQLATPGRAWGVDVAGSLAVVADGSLGATLVDVSDPTQPQIVGSCASPGDARDVALYGSYISIADFGGGLRLCDVQQPAGPTLLGSLVRPGIAAGLGVSGDVAYVASEVSFSLSSSHSLSTIDIHDPAHMQQIGVFDKGGGPQLALWGRYTYLLGDKRLQILDLLDPAKPVEVAAMGVGGLVQSFTVAPSNRSIYAIVAEVAPNSLDAIDVGNPAQPRTVARASDLAIAVTTHGDTIYLSKPEHGLGIYDFTDATTLRSVADLYLDWDSHAPNIAAQGPYVYLADQRHGLRIIDAGDTAHPVEVGLFHSPSVDDVAVDGPRVYVTDGLQRLTIGEISHPAQPVELGSYEDPYAGSLYDLAAIGNYVYLGTQYRGLEAVRLLRDRVAEQVGPAGGSLTSTHSDTVFDFPPTAFTEPVTITYRLLLTDQDTGVQTGIGHTFEVSAVQTDTGEPAPPALKPPFNLSITYTDAEIATGLIDEASLAVYRWDENDWLREPSSAIDLQANRITAAPSRLGLFAVLGDTHRNRFPEAHADR